MKKIFLCEIVEQCRFRKDNLGVLMYKHLNNRKFIIAQQQIDQKTNEIVYRDLFNDLVFNKEGSIYTQDGEDVVVPLISIVGNKKEKIMNYLKYTPAKISFIKDNISNSAMKRYLESFREFAKEYPEEAKKIAMEALVDTGVLDQDGCSKENIVQDIPSYVEGQSGQAILDNKTAEVEINVINNVDNYEEGTKGQAIVKK